MSSNHDADLVRRFSNSPSFNKFASHNNVNRESKKNKSILLHSSLEASRKFIKKRGLMKPGYIQPPTPINRDSDVSGRMEKQITVKSGTEAVQNNIIENNMMERVQASFAFPKKEDECKPYTSTKWISILGLDKLKNISKSVQSSTNPNTTANSSPNTNTGSNSNANPMITTNSTSKKVGKSGLIGILKKIHYTKTNNILEKWMKVNANVSDLRREIYQALEIENLDFKDYAEAQFVINFLKRKIKKENSVNTNYQIEKSINKMLKILDFIALELKLSQGKSKNKIFENMVIGTIKQDEIGQKDNQNKKNQQREIKRNNINLNYWHQIPIIKGENLGFNGENYHMLPKQRMTSIPIKKNQVNKQEKSISQKQKHGEMENFFSFHAQLMEDTEKKNKMEQRKRIFKEFCILQDLSLRKSSSKLQKHGKSQKTNQENNAIKKCHKNFLKKGQGIYSFVMKKLEKSLLKIKQHGPSRLIFEQSELQQSQYGNIERSEHFKSKQKLKSQKLINLTVEQNNLHNTELTQKSLKFVQSQKSNPNTDKQSDQPQEVVIPRSVKKNLGLIRMNKINKQISISKTSLTSQSSQQYKNDNKAYQNKSPVENNQLQKMGLEKKIVEIQRKNSKEEPDRSDDEISLFKENKDNDQKKKKKKVTRFHLEAPVLCKNHDSDLDSQFTQEKTNRSKQAPRQKIVQDIKKSPKKEDPAEVELSLKKTKDLYEQLKSFQTSFNSILCEKINVEGPSIFCQFLGPNRKTSKQSSFVQMQEQKKYYELISHLSYRKENIEHGQIFQKDGFQIDLMRSFLSSAGMLQQKSMEEMHKTLNFYEDYI